MRLFFNSLDAEPTLKEELILPGITYPNDLGLQSGPQTSAEPGGNYQYQPSTYRVQDKTFIAVASPDASNNRIYMVVYDHFRGKVSDFIDTGLEQLGGDSHHMPSIFPTDDNRLFVMVTPRVGEVSQKPTKVSFCGSGYDINSWSAWTYLESSPGVQFERNEYPHMQPRTGGGVNSFMRYQAGDWDGALFYTTDYINWVQHRVLTLDISGDKRPYPLGIYREDGVIGVFINHIDFDTAAQGATIPWLYYLESHDNGITWRNVDNSFSKDTTSVRITSAELQANYLAHYAGVEGQIRATAACLINNKPYAVGGIDPSGTMGLIYWSGSSWVTKAITVAGLSILPAYSNSVSNQSNFDMRHENGKIHVYLYAEESPDFHVVEITSTDDGDSWTLENRIVTNGTSHCKLVYNRSDENILITGGDMGIWRV